MKNLKNCVLYDFDLSQKVQNLFNKNPFITDNKKAINIAKYSSKLIISYKKNKLQISTAVELTHTIKNLITFLSINLLSIDKNNKKYFGLIIILIYKNQIYFNFQEIISFFSIFQEIISFFSIFQEIISKFVSFISI